MGYNTNHKCCNIDYPRVELSEYLIINALEYRKAFAIKSVYLQFTKVVLF